MAGGAVIQRARRRSGLTQAELARRTATTASAVSRWEAGQVEPGYATVERCVEACGLTVLAVLREPEVDPHDRALLDTTLALTVDERAQRLIDYIRVVRAGRAAVMGTP